jgi:hypothetical protein
VYKADNLADRDVGDGTQQAVIAVVAAASTPAAEAPAPAETAAKAIVAVAAKGAAGRSADAGDKLDAAVANPNEYACETTAREAAACGKYGYGRPYESKHAINAKSFRHSIILLSFLTSLIDKLNSYYAGPSLSVTAPFALRHSEKTNGGIAKSQ